MAAPKFHWTETNIATVRKRREEGLSMRAIAQEIKVSFELTRKLCADLKILPPPRMLSGTKRSYIRKRAGRFTLPPLESLKENGE